MNPTLRIFVVCWLLIASLSVPTIAGLPGIPVRLTGTARAVNASVDVNSNLFLVYDMESRLDMAGRITAFTSSQLFLGGAGAVVVQGIATDGTYWYSNKNNASGKSMIMTKITRDASGNFTIVLTHDTETDGPPHLQVNSVFVRDGIIYVGAMNYPTSPAQDWIFEYSTTDLSFLGFHSAGAADGVSDFWTEGTCYNNGTWWVVGNQRYVRQFDSSWNYLNTYYVPDPINGPYSGSYGAGFYGPLGIAAQGCRWDQGLLYIDVHDAVVGTKYLQAFAYVNGGLHFAMNVRAAYPGTDSCGQGFEFAGTQMFCAVRNPNAGVAVFNITRGYNSQITTLNTGPMIDLSGNGHYGNMTGTVLENGRFSASTRFESKTNAPNTNPAPDSIEVLTDSSWYNWYAMSVSLWARTSQNQAQAPGLLDGAALADVFGNGASNGAWGLFLLNNTVRVSVVNSNPTRVDLSYAFSYADGAWHQYGFTWDGSKIWLYVDGTPRANATLTGHLHTPSVEAPFWIGKYNPVDGGFYFNGSVDEVVLFKNRAVSNASMAYLASNNGTLLGVNGTTLSTSSLQPILPAVGPFQAILVALAPFFGSQDMAGYVLGFMVIICVIILFLVLTSKAKGEEEGGGGGITEFFIPSGIGIVLVVLFGWWPLWTVVFIGLILAFVLIDPFGQRSGGGG